MKIIKNNYINDFCSFKKNIKWLKRHEKNLIKFRFFILYYLLSILLRQTSYANDSGYAFIFFNGIWNLRQDAVYSAHMLREKINLSKNFNAQPVRYELFYNQTGCVKGKISCLEDIGEMFLQRISAIDNNLKDKWDIFWKLLSLKGIASITDRSIFGQKSSKISVIKDAIKGLHEKLASSAAKYIASLLIHNDSLNVDLSQHENRIKTLAAEGYKLMLVPHSQGNLFAVSAYQKALEVNDYTNDSIGIFHIAPPLADLRGAYILADKDMVIQSLNGLGCIGVPRANYKLPFKHIITDLSGHTLESTYLNKNLSCCKMIESSVKKKMLAMKTPIHFSPKADLTVTLTWDGLGDVDLHIDEPSGNHIYHKNREGDGYLDIDNTKGYGPEHYYFRYKRGMPEKLAFKVSIVNYMGARGRQATIQVASGAEGEIFSSTVDLGNEGFERQVVLINIDCAANRPCRVQTKKPG